MIHTFDIATLPATPWKNGGGSTREIVCQPPGADMANFDWRVSIATIAASGPFSVFAGVDRMIILLDGAGCATGTGMWWDAAAGWQATPLAPDALLVVLRLHELKV